MKVKKKKKTTEPVTTSQADSLSKLLFAMENLLRFATGTKINVAAAVYKILNEAAPENKPALLKKAAETFGLGDEDDKGRPVPEVIGETERKDLREKYGEAVDALLKALVRRNLPEEVFYSELLALIENPFFAERNARVFALYYCLIDRCIPYFHLADGLKMSEEEFRSRIKSLDRPVRLMRFLLARDFSQKTEQASLILKEIAAHKEREATILLAVVISDLKKRAKERDLIEKLLDQ